MEWLKVGSDKPGGPVVIDNYHYKLAVHNMLVAAESETDIDEIPIGSPFIADIRRRLADPRHAATPGPGRAQRRDAAQHEHQLPRVRAYPARTQPKVPADQRHPFVRDVLVPPQRSDELLAHLPFGAVG